MGKLTTIIAWIILIVFSPIVVIIAVVVGVFISIDAIVKEMARIVDYQIVPYIRWKYHDVRKRFGKKDSN